MEQPIRIAILDDYQNIALQSADWSKILELAAVEVFSDHLENEDKLAERLRGFQVICMMRERTPLRRTLLARLPELKLIVSTGLANRSLDIDACKELGILVANTGYIEHGAPELTWALLLALARNITTESSNVRAGRWQTTIGVDLKGKTLGIIGLGRVGRQVAVYGRAFGMQIIAWSENLTEERANQAGAGLVSKEELFRRSDFVTIHLILSQRSRGIIGEAELDLMKPTAYFINTSRGPLVNEEALAVRLAEKRIAGAALDVFSVEPLPQTHVFRTLDNVLSTPHIGYVTQDTYKTFFEDTVRSIEDWLNKR
jgi:phosphoglycerate dehydrogenase-like enzyme